MKKTVALIYGGEGRERDVSVRSAERVWTMIDKARFDVLPVYISTVGSWYLCGREPFGKMPTAGARPTYPVLLHGKSGLLAGDKILPVDIALPVLHGDFGEDGIIQGALEAAHIPYVGCGVAASAVCADKAHAKAVAERLGIPTAKWVCERGGDAESRRRARVRATESFGYPMFVKPAGLGSSIGASPVLTDGDFDRAFIGAARFGTGVLIEERVPVLYECECAMLELSGVRRYLAGGIIYTGGAFYGYREKYEGENPPKTSHGCTLTPLRERIEEYAARLGDALGLRHISRLDFLVGEGGEIYFNEINTIPGMTATSLYPSLTEDMGFEEGEFINLLLAGAAP